MMKDLHNLFIAAAIALSSCNVATVGSDSAAVEEQTPLTVEVSLPSTERIDLSISWPAHERAKAYLVSLRADVLEGDEVIDKRERFEWVTTATRLDVDAAIKTTVLGPKAHDNLTLRWMDLTVTVEPCVGADCIELFGATHALTRPVSLQVRPYPNAGLNLLGGVDHDGLHKASLDRLNDMVGHCNNVIIAVNGSLYEGDPGTNALSHFVAGRDYDCIVSVSYHDEGGGWGDTTDGDTVKFCQSAELAADSLQRVWEATVKYTDVERWDILGHSKGAAAVVKFYGRDDTKPWPNARFYGVGLPWRMAAEYLPTPKDYRPGRVYAHGQIVAFTWSDDDVRDIDDCIDVDALSIDGTKHDYGPLLRDPTGHPKRAAAREAFLEGERADVGARHEYE